MYCSKINVSVFNKKEGKRENLVEIENIAINYIYLHLY